MARGILQHSLRQRTSSRNVIISGDDSGGGTVLPLTTGGPSKQPKHQHKHRVGKRRIKRDHLGNIDSNTTCDTREYYDMYNTHMCSRLYVS